MPLTPGGGTDILSRHLTNNPSKPNQAWSFDIACEMSNAFASLAPAWLEEPMRADIPVPVWAALAKATSVPIANGENLRGISAFRQMIEQGGIRFVQPDIGKWG